ncbi:hypothetical protein MesoLjLc_72050 [Mesorhizobium sp. L-8-10]|nr:hypothetical protein MesoLjLc_72050 [Mesorhizobium sp. L-8-10]
MTMTQTQDPAATDRTERKAQPDPSGNRVASIVRRLLQLPDRYDPARYYMRGPGPASRRKSDAEGTVERQAGAPDADAAKRARESHEN